jgi:hypothetical protein
MAHQWACGQRGLVLVLALAVALQARVAQAVDLISASRLETCVVDGSVVSVWGRVTGGKKLVAICTTPRTDPTLWQIRG